MQTDDRAKKYIRRRNQRIFAALQTAFESVRPYAYEKPVPYLESTIRLDSDLTASRSGNIRIQEITPYLVRPISYFAERGKHRLTCQAPEQTAKSTTWKLGMIWRQKFLPGPAGIIYQNKEVGSDIIRDSLLPLFRCETEFLSCLPRREGEAPRRLKLPYSVVYLMSGDGPIISYPMSVIVGDEINKWRIEKANRKRKKFRENDDYQVSKIKDMDKRLRTFDDSLRVLVCSPEGKKAPISLEFEKSSRGYWYNRCFNCRKLTFNTTTPEEYFVFETEEKTVRPETIRLKCPECGFLHTETEHKSWICRHGAYIDERPELVSSHMGCCWGALASQMPGVNWLEICTAINTANTENNYEAITYLYNSIKGVPFSPNAVTGNRLEIISKHKIPEVPPDLEKNLCAIYLAVDTQELGYWYSVLAVDLKKNWYTLDYGFAWEEAVLTNVWNNEYLGRQPMAGIIDEGGHRKPDVNAFVESTGPGFFKYKGEAGNYKGTFRISEQDPLLILAKAKYYQADLLTKIHTVKQQERNFWYIVAEIKRTFRYQLCAFQPPETDPEAGFEEWTHGDRQHDLFDTHKMALTLHDFALKYFPPDSWINIPPDSNARFQAVMQK